MSRSRMVLSLGLVPVAMFVALAIGGCGSGTPAYTPPPATEVLPVTTPGPATAVPKVAPSAQPQAGNTQPTPKSTADVPIPAKPAATRAPEGYPAPAGPQATFTPQAYPSR